MSKISSFLKRIILWMLGNGKFEFLIEVAKNIVLRLDNRDDLSSRERQKEANRQIREKLKEMGKSFSSHLINLAIELALVELREELD